MATLQVMECRIRTVRFHAPSKWTGRKFLVGGTSSGETVKGELETRPDPDVVYRLHGEWKEDPKYGPAFHFAIAEEVFENTPPAIARYLERNIPTLGKVRSRAVAEHFGAETLATLTDDPDRLLEVQGMTAPMIAKIKEWLESRPTDPKQYAEILSILDGLRLPKATVDSIARQRYALDRLKNNPYLVGAQHHMGWKAADEVGRRVGIESDDLRRRAAAILFAIHALAKEGHTISPRSVVDSEARALLKCSPGPDAWEAVTVETQEGPAGVGLSYLLNAESAVARNLKERAAQAGTLQPHDASALDELSDSQKAAAIAILSSRFATLTGGPGTGKTFTLSRILKSLSPDALADIAIMAPTGKAAKRAQELVAQALSEAAAGNIRCGTVHRILGFGEAKPKEKDGENPSFDPEPKSIWKHNESNPLPASLVIVDETSMIDVKLASAIVAGTAPGASLVFVGDPDQLPSVGPGSILRDIVESQALPGAHLTETRRNCGRIVKACSAIRSGARPEPSPQLDLPSKENWAHLQIDDPSQIATAIVEVVDRMRKFDRVWDVQVLSPQRNGGAGTRLLNEKLAILLNPNRTLQSLSESQEGPPELCAGDKVVRLKNAKVQHLARADDRRDQIDGDVIDSWTWCGETYAVYESLIVNGDMGEVLGLTDDGWIVVKLRWPDRLVKLKRGDHQLDLAYCMTVHKAQGSGFPVVVAPLSDSFYWDEKAKTGLWCRELVYTLASRAEQLLITVGDVDSLALAATRPTRGRRRTTLKERLRA